MKPSSAPAPRASIDKATAWACLVTNAATIPGLGTIAGGRKIGYAQAAVALLGCGLSLGGLLWHLRGFFAGEGWPEEFSVGLLVGVGGVLCFGAAWIWAFVSSLQLHAEAKRPPPLAGSPDAARSASTDAAPPR